MIKRLVINKDSKHLMISCFRQNSNLFERLPIFKSEKSLEKLYPKSETISKTSPEVGLN